MKNLTYSRENLDPRGLSHNLTEKQMSENFIEHVYDESERFIAERPYAFARLFREGQEYRLGDERAVVLSCVRFHSSLVVTRVRLENPSAFRDLRMVAAINISRSCWASLVRGIKCALRFVFGLPEKVDRLKKWSHDV